jgi:SAM-dependent methyltransferase
MASERIAEVWNQKLEAPKVRDRFWFFPEICSHINLKICGKPLPGVAHGIHERLRIESNGREFERAISVGCGLASKEMHLLSIGIVEHIDLFDLAGERLARAEEAYYKKGLSERAAFFCDDAYIRAPKEAYDLVYWNSSLHHMPDVYAALEWSASVLRPGGMLVMYEFVGPSRFQWSDLNMDAVRRFRASLPIALRHAGSKPDPHIIRPTVAQMIARDPSEAADSARILPSLKAIFPISNVVPIGGAIYHFGLNGIFPKVNNETKWVFEQALLLDDVLSTQGENHFAVATARKQ